MSLRQKHWPAERALLFLNFSTFFDGVELAGFQKIGKLATVNAMSTKTLTLRGRGTLTLPKALRKKYGLEDGEPLTLIDLGGAFVLAPKLLVVPKLVTEIERLRKDAGVSVDELLEGLDEQRQQGYEKRYKR